MLFLHYPPNKNNLGVILINHNRKIPLTLNVYQRLLQRIPIQHPLYSEIESRISRIRAGYSGETYVDHFLSNIEFPCKFEILKDVHIKTSPKTKIQLDTLIITPKFICILEIKAIKGKISFQQNPAQLIREVDGIQTPLKCPEEQLKRHERRLAFWMKTNNINLPIVSFIVLAFSKTHVSLPPKYSKLIMGCDISSYIEDLFDLPNILSHIKYTQLMDKIRQSQTSFSPTPLSSIIPIDYSQLKKGLICPNCSFTIDNLYKCPNCKISRKVMITNAIEDWFHLIKDSITTKECREFLNLNDKTTASHILTRSNLIPKNNGRYRYYKLIDEDSGRTINEEITQN